MNYIRPSIPVLASLVLAACVAKDSDSLGELESSSDGDTGSATEGEATEGSGSSASTEGEGSGETGTPVDSCPDPALFHYEPSGCPDGEAPLLPAAGCYEPCDGPEATCGVGTCAQVEINPCVCPEGEGCCAACGATEWLCVELIDSICPQIVGTTFVSVEQLECGLEPMGPVLCNWQIVLAEDGSYLWTYSDIGQGGDYTCESGMVTVLDDPSLEVAYDPESDVLTWDGVDYVAAPA